MVKYQEAVLDRTFAALADPTRRALLARLEGEDALTVSELARPFKMSLPAVMKHLDVLSDAGLIEKTKTGRTVTCELNAGPMEEAMQWLIRYQRFWSGALDRLASFLEEDECPPTPTSKIIPLPRRGRASPSKSVSRPRPPASTPPGRTPRK
ncbi:MAG: helix-turn-helix transcriptional regulator [Parvibaculum sp.]|nr:helix-turn-helix transcriptional regulator [Parvibaculum sp.]MCW5728727.1 helix-turn-helix transcriptional regulator [Parvibaculum sp.]